MTEPPNPKGKFKCLRSEVDHLFIHLFKSAENIFSNLNINKGGLLISSASFNCMRKMLFSKVSKEDHKFISFYCLMLPTGDTV